MSIRLSDRAMVGFNFLSIITTFSSFLDKNAYKVKFICWLAMAGCQSPLKYSYKESGGALRALPARSERLATAPDAISVIYTMHEIL